MTTVTPTRHNPVPLHTIQLSANSNLSPTIDPPHPEPSDLPEPSHVHQHESAPFTEDAKIQDGGKARLVFVGTATCILEWQGIRIMTDPNFAGEHVHLGPLVTSTRLTNPAFPLSSLPPVHCVVLSHFHADHFDQEVERRLRRDLVVVTTRHAERELKAVQRPDGGFTRVYGMDVWESTLLELKDTLSTREPVVRVVATPGKHIAGVLGAVNDTILHAIPPTNGHILELGYKSATGKEGEEAEEGEGQVVQVGYRIYISGDTLMVDDLKEIPKRYPDVDLLLIHLGGTSIPSAKAPLLMVTMDGKQGIELVRLIGPKLTIPIHFDDYDVFASPRSDFEKEMKDAGLEGKAVYLERGEAFDFGVRG